MSFSQRLSELTSKRGGQAALSKAIGVSSGLVSSWCSGEKEPRAGNVAKIALHFGVTADYLLCLSNESVQPDPTAHPAPPPPETKKAPVPEISENGRRMLQYFEALSDGTQRELIGEAKAYFAVETKEKDGQSVDRAG